MNRNRTRLAGAVALAAAALTAAGCSSGATAATSSSPSSSGSPGSAAPGGGSSKVTLVVYSAQGYDSAEVKAFEKATGIPVKLDDNSTGPLLSQIEASKNNPKWGLLWVDGATAFASLDQQGLLVKGYEPSGVQWNSLGTQSVPKDESYVPTGVTLAAVAAYNKSKVSSPPASWNALLGAKWKGKVGMNDPAQSGPTYPFIAGIMNSLGGASAGESYFSKLKANGLVVHSTNGPTLQALASGQINVALVQNSAATGAAIKNKNIGVAYLKPETLLPSCIGIDSHAPAAEIAEAKKFAAYVLSAAGQKVMQSGDPTGDSLYFPVVRGVTPLAAVPALPSSQVQSIDPYTWGAKESTVNQRFEQNIVR